MVDLESFKFENPLSIKQDEETEIEVDILSNVLKNKNNIISQVSNIENFKKIKNYVSEIFDEILRELQENGFLEGKS